MRQIILADGTIVEVDEHNMVTNIIFDNSVEHVYTDEPQQEVAKTPIFTYCCGGGKVV